MDRAIPLKEEIDRGVRDPTHETVELVCIYLLKTRGYQAAWDWVKSVYGEDFLPDDTGKQLERIMKQEELRVKGQLITN